MKVTFKLYATLQHKLPAHAVNNAVEVDVDKSISLFELIDQFGVPRESAHLVLVNGAYFSEDERSEQGLLSEGDVVAVWPPVAGG
jgi:molybdopterin converting factor small subunit